MARLVYRSGSARDDNLTPRPGKDTVGSLGQVPGLSTFVSLEQAVMPGGKAQVIDLDLLAPPLLGFADCSELDGGIEGHLSIAPAADDGTVDLALLEAWAASRGTGQAHPLTVIVKEALVESMKRPG